jgi:hypothetical protein
LRFDATHTLASSKLSRGVVSRCFCAVRSGMSWSAQKSASAMPSSSTAILVAEWICTLPHPFM